MLFRILRSITAGVLVLALFAANGGWRFPAQLFAWTTMVNSYSKTMPIQEAIKITLSGKKPCHLCHAIKKSTTKTALSDVSISDSQMQLIVHRGFTLPLRDLVHEANYKYQSFSSIWSDSPTPPPPRA